MPLFLENTPKLWVENLPKRQISGHKYDYGHVVIYGAPKLTGATRLAAEACARIGAGLVSVLCTPGTSVIYRETLAAHILVRDDLDWWDDRVTAQLWGSGGLPCDLPQSFNIPTVLDADALGRLPKILNENVVLTPHEGEFSRAFPEIDGSREERALKAAQLSRAIVVLKGAETVIAHPDGRIVVNNHASPHLATAGTGDVLAGMITGLMAQGMAPFNSACAAVWIHGECGIRAGQGLVASDLAGMIPGVLTDLS